MKPTGLKPEQIDEFLEVINGQRLLDFKSGAIRVKGLSKATFEYLKRADWIKKGEDGRYYPELGKSDLYPIFSMRNIYLWPIDVIWRVVEPMLDDTGHAGYSIRYNKRWSLLNLFHAGSLSYTYQDETAIMHLLNDLDSHWYIYFQFGGDVWCIDKRKDREQAA